ncbi:hypothetical protein SMU76_07178, partial [Streptococcus mutans N66]
QKLDFFCLTFWGQYKVLSLFLQRVTIKSLAKKVNKSN